MANATAEKLEQENTQAKIEWKDRSPEEQREMIKANLAYQINRAVANGTSVLFERKSKEDFQKEENIAYSGFNGKAYSGINALMLDNMRNERGYKRNVWLNANEAMKMGANLGKGLEKLKGLPYVEIATIQIDTTRAVRDSKDKIMRDENGKAVLETLPLDRPQLNTHRVYNIEDIAKIQGFQMNKIKPLEKTFNKYGGLRFMSSAHGSKEVDGKKISTFDNTKAIVLEELANIKYKGTRVEKDKDGKEITKEINYSLKDDVIKAVKRYYFAINFPNDERNKGYDFPLEKRFATRMNERTKRVNDALDKTFAKKQNERDSKLQEVAPVAPKAKEAEKKAEVAKTATKKPIVKKNNKKNDKAKEMGGMSM